MSKHLQQLDTTTKNTCRKARDKMRAVLLNAKSALLLGLLLAIIPTISGVALIA
jgi:Na+-translocating ferredoxin:NAD+ oxidoreductase RnfD subunit